MKKKYMFPIYIITLIIVSIPGYYENEKKEQIKLKEPDYLTDSKTGLKWQNQIYTDEETDLYFTNKTERGYKLQKYINADIYCKNLSIEDLDNWRLPTINELTSAYITASIFKSNPGHWFWSSTDVKDNDKNVDCIDFNGGMQVQCIKARTAYIRCVHE